MGRRRPLSRFMFGVAFQIWMASTVHLSQNPSALPWTVSPSQSLPSTPHPSGKLAWWGFILQELDLDITCHSGQKNPKADALSRYPVHQDPAHDLSLGIVVAQVGAPPRQVRVRWGLPVTRKGNKYAVVFMDYLTKWPEVFPTKDQTAPTVTKLLVEEIISRHGVPSELLSDRGSSFLSGLMKEIYSAMGIHKVNTTAYHPQTNGLVERFNRTLIDMCSRPLSPPVDHEPFAHDDYKSLAVDRMSEAWQSANEQIPKAQKWQKSQHDHHARPANFKSGACVHARIQDEQGIQVVAPIPWTHRVVTALDCRVHVRPLSSRNTRYLLATEDTSPWKDALQSCRQHPWDLVDWSPQTTIFPQGRVVLMLRRGRCRTVLC